MIKNEELMNFYFNTGKFNYPSVIGYVMNEIRKCKPLTLNEWRIYYIVNVRSEEFLIDLSKRMHDYIPEPNRNSISSNDCLIYIQDVIFRRTFDGFNKENEALPILKRILSCDVEFSPKEWDGEYFIDFVITNPLVGIQLKPDTFYSGGYDKKVNISAKLKNFERDFNAKTYILIYTREESGKIRIINYDIVEEIKKYIHSN
ncbi:MAG: MjaI family restriction endonuclease [bacterium]|jgi:hypothetical protein|nr:MjaI family restriction endonuclease [bacterium]